MCNCCAGMMLSFAEGNSTKLAKEFSIFAASCWYILFLLNSGLVDMVDKRALPADLTIFRSGLYATHICGRWCFIMWSWWVKQRNLVGNGWCRNIHVLNKNISICFSIYFSHISYHYCMYPGFWLHPLYRDWNKATATAIPQKRRMVQIRVRALRARRARSPVGGPWARRARSP